MYGLHIVDSGSAYDGLYYGGISNDGDTGVWCTSYDSFKGIIGDTGVFLWGLSVLDPGNGDSIPSGSKTPITWLAEGPTTVRIEFSSDMGVTWITVADSIGAKAGYLWTVPDVSSSSCRIRVIDVNDPGTYGFSSGFFTITGTSGVTDVPFPRTFAVSNRPNPFNPSTTISFTLPVSGRATLTVYDITGRKMRELLSGSLSTGSHSVQWDGKDEHGAPAASGVYLARLSVGKFAATGKMLLVR